MACLIAELVDYFKFEFDIFRLVSVCNTQTQSVLLQYSTKQRQKESLKPQRH